MNSLKVQEELQRILDLISDNNIAMSFQKLGQPTGMDRYRAMLEMEVKYALGQVQEDSINPLEGSTISSLIEEAEEEFRIFDRMSVDTGRKVLDLVKKQQQRDESKP